MTEEEVANTAVLSGKNNEQVEKGMSGTIDSENTISGTTPSLPGKTVLLVEDNEEIRSYVKGHLEQYYKCCSRNILLHMVNSGFLPPIAWFFALPKRVSWK